MDPKPKKRIKYRVKKTRVKKPNFFTLKLAGIFGKAYLENSRQINIGIGLLTAVLAGLILLMLLGSPVFNFRTPPVVIQRQEM